MSRRELHHILFPSPVTLLPLPITRGKGEGEDKEREQEEKEDEEGGEDGGGGDGGQEVAGGSYVAILGRRVGRGDGVGIRGLEAGFVHGVDGDDIQSSPNYFDVG